MSNAIIHRSLLFLGFLFYYFGVSAQAQTGLSRMARPELLPVLYPPGTVTKQAISVDYSGGNEDGNFLKSFTKYIDANGEHVIFDEYGPGCLYRQQMNIWTTWVDGPTAQPNAGRCRIRYYFDDEAQPRLDRTMDELFGGQTPDFTPPLLFTDPIKRFAALYYPLCFQKRLKVTVVPPDDWSKRIYTWHQFTYHAFPTATGLLSWSATTGSKDRSNELTMVHQQWQRLGQDPKDTTDNQTISRTLALAPGDSQRIELPGAGSITSLNMKLEPYTLDLFFKTYLRIYWDGQQTPSVDLPLAYFFGSGGASYLLTAIDVPTRSLKTLFFGYDGPSHTMYAYWPMAYWAGARLELVNHSSMPITALTCRIGYKSEAQQRYLKSQCGYFCAKRTVDEQYSTKPYALAFAERGRGHVVGLTFYSDGYDMDGDEFTYIDDSRSPQIHGDGTEDDHNQGWGGSNFQQPLWGGLLNGYQGAYRIYMNDAYIFNKNIAIRYEYSNQASLTRPKTDITVFYYKAPPTDTLQLTDQLDVGNPASEKAHTYQVKGSQNLLTVSSSYDGYEKQIAYDSLADSGRRFNGYSQFRIAINPSNEGVRLRKRTDRRGTGPKTAKVWVNGVLVTERKWHLIYPLSITARQAWGDADFEIPAYYTRGKSTLTIRIQSADWNEFQYTAYSYPSQHD